MQSNSPSITLVDSVGQELRQGTEGLACFCSVMFGPQKRRLRSEWARPPGTRGATSETASSLGVVGSRGDCWLAHLHVPCPVQSPQGNWTSQTAEAEAVWPFVTSPQKPHGVASNGLHWLEQSKALQIWTLTQGKSVKECVTSVQTTHCFGANTLSW